MKRREQRGTNGSSITFLQFECQFMNIPIEVGMEVLL